MALGCDHILKKALARQMSQQQIDDFADQVGIILTRAKALPNLTEAQRLIMVEAAQKRLRALTQKRATRIQQQRVLDNFFQIKNHWRGREWEGVESLEVGTQYNREGSRFSVGAIAKGYEESYIGELVNGIRGLGKEHFELFRKGKLDREIAKALWLVETPDQYHGPGMAMEIAQVIHGLQERTRYDQNKTGAAILKLKGYVVRQSHDQAKILGAGYEEWRDCITARLDWTKTADGQFDPKRDPKAAEDFLTSLYEAFASGLHEKKGGGAPANPLGQGHYSGMRAAKLNKNRVLHFKDGEAWFEYNERFGYGTLRDALMQSLRKSAGDTALMRVFGPSPRAGFDNLKNKLMKLMKDEKRWDDIERFRKKGKRLENNWNVLDGSADIPGNPTLGMVGRTIRSWNNMTKLGGVLLSSISDAPTFAEEFSYHGAPFFRSLAEGIKLVCKGRGSEEEQRILSACGVFFDSMNGLITDRFWGNNFEGKVTAMSNLFFRVNGLSWWTDAWKKAAGLMLSHELATWAAKDFASLTKEAKRLLTLYGIKEDEWNLLRLGKQQAADGKSYLTPEIARDISKDDIKALFQKTGRKYFPAAAEQFRDELEERLRTLIRDRVSYAVLEPDARTRALLYQGTKGGTPIGEALRCVVQFKSFPVAFMQKTISRELYGRDTEGFWNSLAHSFYGNNHAEINHFARLFLMMTLFGYGSMTAKNLAAGRTPRDPTNPNTWMAAALQGGGLGLYGDFLLGEKSRMGSSFWSSLGGPTGTTMEQIVNLWWDTTDGKIQDRVPEIFRLAFNNTPGNNLFYARAAFDYFIGYNLYEMMSPGYFNRMRKRIRKENNQELIFTPMRW